MRQILLLLCTLISIHALAQNSTIATDSTIRAMESADSARILQAVTVKARKQVLEIENGKLVFNIAGSAIASGASALDLLRKMPGVSLGQDDQIMLKGAPGVNVMLDGKMTYLSEQQLVQLLRGINAENISRIELISAPAAEFDAAGNAGIINIVTKKDLAQGYSLDLRSALAKGNFWMFNQNITAGYRGKKLTLSGAFDYNMPYTFVQSRSGNTIMQNGSPVRIRRELQTPTHIHFYTYKAQLTWQVTPRQQLSAGYDGYLDDYVKNNARSVVNRFAADGQMIAIVKSNNYLEEPYHYDAANAGYLFRIDSSGKKLTADAHYISYRNFSDGILSTDYFNASGASAQEREVLRVHQPGTVTIRSLKADLDLPFKTIGFKAGLKYANIQTRANYRFDSLINGAFEEAKSMSNQFLYREQIAAAYVSASKKVAGMHLEAGLRVESTHAKGYTVETGIDNRWQYTSLFPSFSADRTFNLDHKLNLSVSRRINRPTYANLNPVRWYYDPYFFYSGNPFLKPELAWTYSAGYTFKERYVLTASYARRKDFLSRRLAIEPGTQAIVSQSFNFEKMERLDLLLSLPFKPATFWDVQLTGGTSHTTYPIPLIEGSKMLAKWAGSVMLNQQFSLPAGLQMELSATWFSSELWGIYAKRAIFFTDFGVKKSFVKNKLEVRFTCSDFLRTNRYRGRSLSDFTNYYYDDLPDTRRISLSVRYHIGGKLQGGPPRRIEEQDRL